VATDRCDDWSPGREAAGGVAGVLALPLDPARDEWLLFFRREQVEEVRWAGRPDQPMELGDDGQRLGPRRSFEAWTETVRGTSAPWSDADLRIASRLGLALREFHQRGGGQAEARELRGRRNPLDVRGHRERLLRLSELLDSLVHVDPGTASALAERIARLEEELRQLITSGDAVAE